MPGAPHERVTVDAPVSGPPPVVRQPWWRRLWERWKAFAEVVGNFQARLILGIFYFVLAAPFGLALRLFADPLGLRQRRASYWEPLPPEPSGIEAARRQS